ncbi:unnamed protein product [Amoebophrya sp. A120]|nr:unnamed protein product [Amoebophrya sp. A120]|eukprot:GSA120T00007858001.1
MPGTSCASFGSRLRPKRQEQFGSVPTTAATGLRNPWPMRTAPPPFLTARRASCNARTGATAQAPRLAAARTPRTGNYFVSNGTTTGQAALTTGTAWSSIIPRTRTPGAKLRIP